MDAEVCGWVASAEAWIKSQGEEGDASRRLILDPCLESVLADVKGLDILDVGCGEGRYSRRLAARGARVVGIDPVPAFVQRAKERDPDSSYLVGFGESLPLPNQSFDLVLSYLSIIDIPDYRTAIAEMARVLRPGGRIIVATISNLASTSVGWVKDESGRKIYRTVDRYMEEFALDLDWQEIKIQNFHRPLSAILKPFFEASMVLDLFLEPLPAPELAWYEDERRAPNFQVMGFRRG